MCCACVRACDPAWIRPINFGRLRAQFRVTISLKFKINAATCVHAACSSGAIDALRGDSPCASNASADARSAANSARSRASARDNRMAKNSSVSGVVCFVASRGLQAVDGAEDIVLVFVAALCHYQVDIVAARAL